MNIKEIKEIIKIMNNNDLAEFELERQGTKLKIKKNSTQNGEQVVMQPVVQQVPVTPTQTPITAQVPTPATDNCVTIDAPMVGTFYRAPSPESPAFVESGQIVEVGQVVCIVEAMKLMNEIKSEVKGKILEISVENGEPIEYGQAMFKIEPLK